MSKGVISVDSSVTVNDAAKMMEDTKVGAVIVMENNTPIGIITDRDFAIKIAAHAYPIQTPVKKVMSSPLIGVNPDESVLMVADLMYTRGVRKIPVIDEDKVIGIVTATDLVNQFAVSTQDDIRKMYYESITRIYSHQQPYA
jgi:CBS domain-containing protein